MATSKTKNTDSPFLPNKLTSIISELYLSKPTENPDLLANLKIFHHGTLPPKTPDLPSFPLGEEPIRHPELLASRIIIDKVEGKGLGLFAARNLRAGSLLLFELPLITYTKSTPTHSTLPETIASLPTDRKKAWYNLHANMANPENTTLDIGILYTNGFSIKNDTTTGVFETASRINHSCVPNSMWEWKEELRRMIFWNRWDLMEGEEVTVDYGHRRGALRRWYGFECDCGGCTEDGSESEDEVDDKVKEESKESTLVEKPKDPKENVQSLVQERVEDEADGACVDGVLQRFHPESEEP